MDGERRTKTVGTNINEMPKTGWNRRDPRMTRVDRGQGEDHEYMNLGENQSVRYGERSKSGV